MPITNVNVAVSGNIVFSRNNIMLKSVMLDIRKVFVCDHFNIFEQPLDQNTRRNADDTLKYLCELRAHDFTHDNVDVSGTVVIKIDQDKSEYVIRSVPELKTALEAVDQILPAITQRMLLHQQSESMLNRYENIHTTPSPEAEREDDVAEQGADYGRSKKRTRVSRQAW